MNKQELIKALKEERNDYHPEYNYDIRLGFEGAIEMVEELLDTTEAEPLVIPQFVADYIEFCKGWNGDRQEYIEEDNSGLWFALDGDSCGIPNSVSDWLFNEEKVETFARAWLDGYEVEKEKLYYVIDKSKRPILTIYEGKVTPSASASKVERAEELSTPDYKYRLTEKQIKDYDERFWPFAVEVAE